MTTIAARREPVEIHVDSKSHAAQRAEEKRRMAELKRKAQDDNSTESEEDDQDIVQDKDAVVRRDMATLEQSFSGFSSRFKLVSKIGEVYKAEDYQYSSFRNEWDSEAKLNQPSPSGSVKRARPHYVAIKKIYVTSSPARIMNELELLRDLTGCDSVAPLITAFRHSDQVVAILPYFSHPDFRTYFRDMSIADMRVYFRSLCTALTSVHGLGIIHRDIKPTNFLYNPALKRGVLVDFGLAERDGVETQACVCQLDKEKRRRRHDKSYNMRHPNETLGMPKDDRRPSTRANRAGTRGFRAPEVLFKCTAQTTKIDMWAAGVILLTIMSKRFPFFHSQDDVDAVIEMASIFGRSWMYKAAILHGQLFETNIPTITESGYSLVKIVKWSTDRPTRNRLGHRLPLLPGESEAFDFLERCLAANPAERLSAEEAMRHEFLADNDGSQDEMDILSMS